MTRSKKKKLKLPLVENEPVEDTKAIPIKNLPDKFLWMRVKSGTKMRNVLQYALKHFSESNTVIWTAVGQGIEKAISCAELFKRQHSDLHQITKLRYITSDQNATETVSSKNSRVPEIHILLTKNPTHSDETGYQGPGDLGEFVQLKNDNSLEKSNTLLNEEQGSSSKKITNLAAEEFAAMGLRTGQKRSKKELHTDTPYKKNKKKQT